MAELGKNIEENLVEPIISILPPKTLMRFKCVSKQWYALINNPRFVAKHLSNSISMHNTTTRVLLTMKDTNSDDPDDHTTEEVSYSWLKFCNVDNDNDEHSFLASCEDVNMSLLNMARTGESLCVIDHCNGIICLAIANSCEVLLWNPAIEEFKLLPTLPYLPDSDPPAFGSPQVPWWRFKDALGFGYCPKSNDYQLVNIGFSGYEDEPSDEIYIWLPPKAAVYTLGTDSWREAKSCSLDLETEITILWPEKFQMYFKGICYWIGRELHKEEDVYGSTDEEQFIRGIIVLFDPDDEVFHAMLLPDNICDWKDHCMTERLLVWNESIALFGTHASYGNYIFGIWVMDEFGVHNGAWTKHFTFDELRGTPLTFLKSDEILMAGANECLFSYNLGTKNLKYLPIQRLSDDSAAVVYVDSIVSLLGGNKLETGDNSTNADFSLYKCSPFSYSMADKKCHSYSVWAIPPDDVCLRIKKIMDGLRAEFAGPEIEPHIPVVGSIRMTHDEVLSKFRSLQSSVIYSFKAKVYKVVTMNFYYQCVSLLIDSSYDEKTSELYLATRQYGANFDFITVHRPLLSLLCGNLNGEERKLAQEKVNIMDESITSLSFPITRLALYKINYRDTTLKSWEKIEEYPLLFNN